MTDGELKESLNRHLIGCEEAWARANEQREEIHSRITKIEITTREHRAILNTLKWIVSSSGLVGLLIYLFEKTH